MFAMRLFVALDIDETIRERITRFLDAVEDFAPDARWVRPESLHVTLKFIGEIDELKLTDVKKTLSMVRAAAVTLHFSCTGFFPTPKRARVFWIGITSDEKLTSLARAVDESLHSLPELEIERETREFSPHLTLARGKPARCTSASRKSGTQQLSGSPQRLAHDRPNDKFGLLQEKLANMSSPGFGAMTAHEFFLYQSKLSPSGSRYTKLERFSLEAGPAR